MNENLFCIKDKVILITGGCGVLGSALSRYLTLQGAKIVILNMAAEKGASLTDAIRSNGGEALFLTTNVMDKETLEANRATIVQKYGRIDAFINTVGGNMTGADQEEITCPSGHTNCSTVGC
jgi:NADP-dependent 3-hydroxy acid dehydrogenase YdfG